MDNTGPYLSIHELLDKLYPSSVVPYRSKLTLSNKVGDTFSYTGATFQLAKGNVLCQGEFVGVVDSATSNSLTLEDATDFVEGVAWVYAPIYDVSYLSAKILSAMQIIDTYTGQWFNKRELNVNIEGLRTKMIHFQVPIISVDSIYLNGSLDQLPTSAYLVYNCRTIPDDRCNPKVKMFNGVFLDNCRSTINGAWGWLEADGSTPELIKLATSKIIMANLLRDPMQISRSQIKSEKTDIHEIQYAVSASSGSNEAGAGRTGDTEVDRIIQLYKAPAFIGGTSSDVFVNGDMYYG